MEDLRKPREQILSEAGEAISGPRAEAYGDAYQNLSGIAILWTAYLETKNFDASTSSKLTAEDVCHLMSLLKIGRTIDSPPHKDNYVDSAGYQALAGEMSWEEST